MGQAFVKQMNTKNFEQKYSSHNNTALLNINGLNKYVNLRRIKFKPKHPCSTF